MNQRIAVIGATGDVGRGITTQALSSGWQVTAVGRSAERLADLSSVVDDSRLRTVVGSLATAGDAESLGQAINVETLTAVVVSTSADWAPRAALEVTYDDADSFFRAYLGAQVVAATALIPRMAPGSVFVSIGGGMADFPARGMSVVSMAQAAQRMWIRHLEKEAAKAHGVVVREVMIHAMVAAGDDVVGPGGMSAADVGAGVCKVVEDPSGTDGPIVSLSAGA